MPDATNHIVVTGGTGALGAAVVGALLADGAVCHVPNFDERELDGFPHAGDDRVHVPRGVDLTDQAAVDRSYAALPPLWGSVHLAGGFLFSAIADTDAQAFDRQMRMNALTCFLCCRAAVASLRGRANAGLAPGGRIVNVAARPALEPRTGAKMIAYTAAKSAVRGITEALAEELAGEAIWVNAVAPSILDTPTNRADMPKAPHGDWPKVADVAAVVAFLASPANKVARGGIVPVYGRL